MLNRIESILIHADDLEDAAAYYADVFGLCPLWSDETSIGLGFPQADAQVVLHRIQRIPAKLQVHFAVDDVDDAVKTLASRGCVVLAAPFDIRTGRCAVVKDPFGMIFCLQDRSDSDANGQSTRGNHPPESAR
jgi:predicted enzyme related to lactoylglutathione lyase